MKYMHRATVLLVTPSLLLVACGTEAADDPSPTATSTPQTTSEPTRTEATEIEPTTSEPTEDQTTTEEASYDPSMDAVTLMHDDAQGVRVEAFFVLDADDQQIHEAAQACVDHYIAEGNSAAYCYGFASMEAIEAANIDESDGGMEHLCWRARDGQAHGGNRSGQETNFAYTDPCP